MRIHLAACAFAAFAAPAAAQDHSGHEMGSHASSMAMDHAHPAALTRALAMENRAEDRARDQYRHPFETLDFFEVKPSMTVVDYMPASGWYTRVLVPYLGAEGNYIGLTPDPAAADGERFANYFGGLPEAFLKVAAETTASLDGAGAQMSIYGSQDVPEELKGQVDRVLVFREMHNLLRSGAMYTELMRMRGLLKDDGMLGIVQHRAKSDAPGDYTTGANGYLRQEDVIALVEAHGFELVGMSDINANPQDSADHEGGVWQMPPSWGGKKPELENIGESDRMTLLFRKR
ncbi:class I SAM-dependent methyltransferase [Erythrobacter sp. A6_0]|uniref:class I SAM-dependent methyltransferase n=1 Tax=Erythrobacter sp. A6_0 TaxID=2821089 RepID=UPI001ADA3832|nr:class I SAM-dependent methyltransferase [Erythrobacter sp. A6_0]MBO9511623.1 class I SAM-dependent methyltransferase [Erythrobacter sp. A6_0]